jgi:hypothetical protein
LITAGTGDQRRWCRYILDCFGNGIGIGLHHREGAVAGLGDSAVVAIGCCIDGSFVEPSARADDGGSEEASLRLTELGVERGDVECESKVT